MCGFTGFINGGQGDGDAMRAVAVAMAETLRYRGPDDGGAWVDAEAGVALAHRRLAIVDLSPAGHQPMVSADGRLVIAYNGEIYNSEELRAALPGVDWRGHSDTECILEACAAWGIEATLQRLIGMFAFALWDRGARTLWLARDRLGIKPLYWARIGAALLFGSELKALKAHPAFVGDIDRAALGDFLHHAYIPAPRTIYAGVSKLEPGTLLALPWQGVERVGRWWDLAAVARQGLAEPLDLPDREAADRLEALLIDAVRRRMIADVPLGSFLSGGIDSSVVTALMQRASSRPVRTFSIGFREQGYDEAQHAAAVARHLGTDHTEMYVAPAQALDLVPELPRWYDEPFADPSQIPTLLLSQMTRRHVTVALSGDGGDELFAGYNRHVLAATLWPRLERAPRWSRRAAAAAIRALPPSTWSALLPMSQAGDKLHKLADVLATDARGLYARLIAQWPRDLALGAGGDPPAPAPFAGDVVADMQFRDLSGYLPDDVLTKVDRASMAVALEARVPLLDHRVVAFSWRLPRRQLVRGGQGKWLLREVLYRHVPRHLVERPKAGFSVPIDGWLRGSLRDWGEGMLDECRLSQDGFIRPERVRRAWEEHLSGRRNLQYRLWTVLMFQQWLDAERSSRSPRSVTAKVSQLPAEPSQ